MTWQRIDENIYIDDTLVTCAEYQLFIDEMREQGKYYQPDHWTSYQFPKGQAYEPILGVRHSDALMFCEWITKRELTDWTFRLPIHKEVIDYPIHSRYKSPIGLWIGREDNLNFVWMIKPFAKQGSFDPVAQEGTPGAPDFSSVSNKLVEADNPIYVTNYFASPGYLRTLNLDRARRQAMARSHLHASGFDLAYSFDRYRELANNLEVSKDLASYFELVPSRNNSRRQISDLSSSISFPVHIRLTLP